MNHAIYGKTKDRIHNTAKKRPSQSKKNCSKISEKNRYLIDFSKNPKLKSWAYEVEREENKYEALRLQNVK